jgi:protein-S-isoprenylcysteine O-methyltransferase Ste14
MHRPATAFPVPSAALVALQLAALAALALPWGRDWHDWGWPPLAAAALLGAWTLRHNQLGNFGVMPEPKPHAQLVTSGPYSYVRHPIYLAVLLFGAGMLVGWRSWQHLLAFAVLCVVLHFKADREEALMSARFPGYAAYRARTKRLIPFVI